MYICEEIDKKTLGNAIDWLQSTLDDDFLRQSRNTDIGAHYFRDVTPTLPGFTSGYESITNIQVHVDASFFKR